MALTPSERKIIAPELEVHELGRDPSSLPYLRQANDLVAALAHLVAVYGGQSVLLKADAAGALMVNTGAGGASTTIPFWGATAPDIRIELYATGAAGSATHDYGAAANRRIAYQLMGSAEHRSTFLYDADSTYGTDRLLLPAAYDQIGIAYTTGRYLYQLSQAAGAASLNVHVWNL